MFFVYKFYLIAVNNHHEVSGFLANCVFWKRTETRVKRKLHSSENTVLIFNGFYAMRCKYKTNKKTKKVWHIPRDLRRGDAENALLLFLFFFVFSTRSFSRPRWSVSFRTGSVFRTQRANSIRVLSVKRHDKLFNPYFRCCQTEYLQVFTRRAATYETFLVGTAVVCCCRISTDTSRTRLSRKSKTFRQNKLQNERFMTNK